MDHTKSILLGVLALAVIVFALWLAAGAGSQPQSSTFVGAMGQHPHLVPCAFPQTSSWMLNRCSYA